MTTFRNFIEIKWRYYWDIKLGRSKRRQIILYGPCTRFTKDSFGQLITDSDTRVTINDEIEVDLE